MDTIFASQGERRRLQYLASRVSPTGWVVTLSDPSAEVAAVAAAATPARVAALVGPDPSSATRALAEAELQFRVQIQVGDPLDRAAAWNLPVHLLVLPARDPKLPALLAAWERHVGPIGHIVLVGGPGPEPGDLGLSLERWEAHVAPGNGTFLLIRRPHG